MTANAYHLPFCPDCRGVTRALLGLWPMRLVGEDAHLVREDAHPAVAWLRRRPLEGFGFQTIPFGLGRGTLTAPHSAPPAPVRALLL